MSDRPGRVGDRIFEDGHHLHIALLPEIGGEERFKVVGLVERKLFAGMLVWRAARALVHPGEKE